MANYRGFGVWKSVRDGVWTPILDYQRHPPLLPSYLPFSHIFCTTGGGGVGYEYFFELSSKLEGLNRGLNRPASFTNTPPTLCGIPYRSGATSSRTNEPARDARSTCIMRHESRCVGPYRPYNSRGYLTASHSNTPAKRRAMISYYPFDLLSQSFQVLMLFLPDY